MCSTLVTLCLDINLPVYPGGQGLGGVQYSGNTLSILTSTCLYTQMGKDWAVYSTLVILCLSLRQPTCITRVGKDCAVSNTLEILFYLDINLHVYPGGQGLGGVQYSGNTFSVLTSTGSPTCIPGWARIGRCTLLW